VNYAFKYISKHKSGLNNSNRDKIKINSGKLLLGITRALPQLSTKINLYFAIKISKEEIA
jgi:hypothetical protein